MKALWRRLFVAVGGYIRATDRYLWAIALTLSGISVLLLLGLLNTGYATRTQLATQLIAACMGITAAIILSNLDYHVLAGLWKLYMPACLLLVLLTFTPLGVVRGDDQAWLSIPVINYTIQPSEFLKLAFIFTFSLHLERVRGEVNKIPNLVKLCIHGAIPVLLIHLQGDDGSAMIFLFIFVCMLFAAGLDIKYILWAAGAAVLVAPLVWFFVLTEDQKERFLIFTNPASDPTGKGWQQYQGLLAIGSGGVSGTGIFSGQHVYVGEARNDFIFTFLAESLGFLGCLGLIALFMALCIKILWNSTRAEDPLGQFLCVGVFAMIAFQVIINLGMCLSVLPVIGVTLPLLSSGGTSVLTVYISLGIVLSVYHRSRINMFIDT